MLFLATVNPSYHSPVFVVSGTTARASCPPLRFIDKEGAGSESECQPCPAGRICPENSTLSIPCYPGHYCEASQPIQMCPERTYNDLDGATDVSWCKPCPPGYWCNEEGMADFTVSPCPPGFFCTNATYGPEACPPGTYR